MSASTSTPKQYSVNITNFVRSKASVKPKNFTGGQEYEFDLSYFIKDFRSSSRKSHSVVLRSTTTSPPRIVGIGENVLSLSRPIYLCFGDPDAVVSPPPSHPPSPPLAAQTQPPPQLQPPQFPETGTNQESEIETETTRREEPSTSPSPSPPTPIIWESIYCHSPLLTNLYEFTIDFGPSSTIGRKYLQWKRTHAGEGIGPIAKKLDTLNLKLEDRLTGRKVARFVHYPLWGWRRGYFEISDILEDGNGDRDGGGVDASGEDRDKWVEVVFLSGMTVLELMRKLQGWSF